MAIEIYEVLEILRAHDIVPEEPPHSTDVPAIDVPEFPEVGEVLPGETIYATSIAEVFSDDDDGANQTAYREDPRLVEWWEDIQRIIDDEGERTKTAIARHMAATDKEPPEPHCAWYCPIHYFGHGWGIYIRENCILSLAKDIALFVDWRLVRRSPTATARQLLRSAFYVFFLHEQFHHKVESLGFRLLIATNSDRYRAYKSNVYRAHYLTSKCLEESLANAESYRRLDEKRYKQRVNKPIRDGLRRFLKAAFPLQPPGYAEGLHFVLDDMYRDGLYQLQSQMLDGALPPITPSGHWSVAPNLITALTDITDDIYVVLPVGSSPLFRPTSVDPGFTVSTGALVSALTKHYGYKHVPGGKGSHVKLKKAGAQTIILPGNRPVLSPGVVKHALNAVGGHPRSRLPELLEGTLSSNARSGARQSDS